MIHGEQLNIQYSWRAPYMAMAMWTNVHIFPSPSNNFRVIDS